MKLIVWGRLMKFLMALFFIIIGAIAFNSDANILASAALVISCLCLLSMRAAPNVTQNKSQSASSTVGTIIVGDDSGCGGGDGGC